MVLCAVGRVLFESAEKLEAVSAVREYENLQREDSPTEYMSLLQDIIFDAGRHCAPPVSHACACAYVSALMNETALLHQQVH